VYDPWVNAAEARHEYGFTPVRRLRRGSYDAIVIGVAHRQFREMGIANVRALARRRHVLYDIKYVFGRQQVDGRL
jgi:UDP-N-acetyl-D-galactosamine dehydrogenase